MKNGCLGEGLSFKYAEYSIQVQKIKESSLSSSLFSISMPGNVQVKSLVSMVGRRLLIFYLGCFSYCNRQLFLGDGALVL